jgi:MHS family proline/betaine transporter-like MFS transporter
MLKQKLTGEQKEAVCLLSIGTFLEYFDLMLYVHMAVLLNELFFPKYDSHTTSLLSSFSFCSIFVFRPLGALLFGWLGDNIGRKITVIITTFMMAMSCIIMANLPTYAQAGIIASCLVTICRIAQGMSSMGEIVGAEIYVTEITRPPTQYTAVMLISICAVLGGTAALGVASLVTSYNFNWRNAFWIGAVTAIVGMVARTKLRETPDFADAKRELERFSKETKSDRRILQNSPIWKEKVSTKTSLALLLLLCGWPVCFYFIYVHCANILRNQFHFTPEQVIHQNFIVSMVSVLGYAILTFLSSRIHPIKILKAKVLMFSVATLICPYLLDNITCSFQLLLIQSFFVLFHLSTNPATPIFYTHIPVFKRFTYGSVIYSLSRALMHITTSFGLVYLVKSYGNFGILIIMVPTAIGYTLGLLHFDKLEKAAQNY